MYMVTSKTLLRYMGGTQKLMGILVKYIAYIYMVDKNIIWQ